MGMMILRHFDDQEHDADDSDDSVADPENGERENQNDLDRDTSDDRERVSPDDHETDALDKAKISDGQENNKKAKTEKETNDIAENAYLQSNIEKAIKKQNKIPVKANGMKVASDELDDSIPVVDKDDEKPKNGLRKQQENIEDMKMSVDGESSKADSSENIFDITPEENKSSDLDDIVMAGDMDCDKGGNKKHEDSESDYESGDETPESQNTDEHQPRRADPPLDIERILALNVQRVRERITSELGALGSQDSNEVNPPDAPPFDTDDDDDDHDMQVDFLESLKRQARSSCPPRKLRYSSNTSVDTSTTSGIGSYTDDHLDAEMASHMNDSQKTSPGTISMDGPPELTKLSSKRQQMDCSDSEDAEEDEDKEESFPKETLGKFLCESVESLPLPTALRSYVMYYRN